MKISKSLKESIFAIVKNKPDKTVLTDEELQEALERVVLRVGRFCRLRELPEALKYTLADMTADAYDVLYPKTNVAFAAYPGTVASITQGDTSVTFEKDSTRGCRTIEDVLKKYVNELMPYKSIYWR